MKKVIALLLVLVLALTLCACGKSQAVKDVESAIKAIGEVSLESNDAILKAERLYDNLTDSEKAKVENKAMLVEARFAYDRFYNDKVYSIAKEAYELLCEAEKLYCYQVKNLYDTGTFGKNNNLSIMDDGFCQKLADATSEYVNYPKLTETEIQDALELYCEDFQVSGNIDADMLVCMNVFLKGMFYVREYYPLVMVEDAGALLLELDETYKDEKYYPVLVEYRDFVATGETIKMTFGGKLSALLDGYRAYQADGSQYQAKLSPMFVD